MTTPDPLVSLWRISSRPLNWRGWQALNDQELARMRSLLMRELQALDQEGHGHTFGWRHTHRELLEIKTASGRHR
jgi:hypothetical protein